MALVALKHIQVFKRPGDVDILYGWSTRDTDTDVLVQWNGSGWTEIFNLPGAVRRILSNGKGETVLVTLDVLFANAGSGLSLVTVAVSTIVPGV